MPKMVWFNVQNLTECILSPAVQQANVGGTPLYKDAIRRWMVWMAHKMCFYRARSAVWSSHCDGRQLEHRRVEDS